MRKIAIALSTIAALSTAAIVTSPAEARGGRNAAIGLGLAAGAIAAGVAASNYDNGYGYGGYRDSYAYDPSPRNGYSNDGYDNGYYGGGYNGRRSTYTGGGQLPY